MVTGTRDPHVETLRRLFETHPVWLAAARHLAPGACSAIRFSHRPREEWTLHGQEGRTVLEAGRAPDPDLAFTFPPAAIEKLDATRGGIADFSLALFRLIEETDPDLRVGFQVVAPFSRLVRRGYVRLLVAAGPRVLAFGVARGVATLGALRRRVERSRKDPKRS